MVLDLIGSGGIEKAKLLDISRNTEYEYKATNNWTNSHMSLSIGTT